MRSYLTAVLAVTPDGLMGDQGRLPWFIPSDLQRFRSLTTHNDGRSTVVMGSKTAESLSGPLPGRRNRVVTRDRSKWGKTIYGFQYGSLEDSLVDLGSEEVYVIGGAQIFKEVWSELDSIELTLVLPTVQIPLKEGLYFIPDFTAFREIDRRVPDPALTTKDEHRTVYYRMVRRRSLDGVKIRTRPAKIMNCNPEWSIKKLSMGGNDEKYHEELLRSVG